MSDASVIVAMWSGPRNLSTALMYSFANRADCMAWDEPFYAAYLAATGLDHPMRAAVLTAYDDEPTRVAARCRTPRGDGRIWYQKHMTHHMLAGFPVDWMDAVTNAFLIRRPEAVVASYDAKRSEMQLEDLGFIRQRELFERVADRLGHAPPVVDADTIRGAPEATLEKVCAALRIPFDPAMVRWPAGPKSCDGVWSAHWYDAVHRSTGFTPPKPPAPLDPSRQRLADAAWPHYEALARFAL